MPKSRPEKLRGKKRQIQLRTNRWKKEEKPVSCRRERMKKGQRTGVGQKLREKKERECGGKRNQDKIETERYREAK